MFTGIVEELGRVTSLQAGDGSARLMVAAAAVLTDASRGASIAVNGCCLTVTAFTAAGFAADVMGETLARSSLGALAPGDPVNLERPVRADGRLGGHVVQGHVDATGTLADRRIHPDWHLIRIEADLAAAPVVAKGSIAVDGVSLTVIDCDAAGFTVGLIPETLANTTLGHRQPGETVNLEFDVLGKYVERLLRERALPGVPGSAGAQPVAPRQGESHGR